MADKEKTTKKKAAAKRVSPPRKIKIEKRESKPVFSLGTIITIALFAVAVLGIFLINRRNETKAAEATPTEGTTYAVSISEAVISSIEVKPLDGDAVRIERPQGGAWKLTLPIEAEANQGLAEAAASQLASLTVINPIKDGSDPSIFGLDEPTYTVTVETSDKTKHILEVGDSTPTGSGYYVRVDDGDIVIVDLSGVEALTALALNPPYLNTPTPSPLPPTATPELPTPTAPPAEAGTETPTPAP